MSAMVDSSEYLKIDEAARLLRVTRRTVYRRIWKGDLPASKVGGIYLIRRGDLQEMLSQGRVTSPSDVARPEAVLPPLKCGNCFRILNINTQIGAVCVEEGCEQLVCTRCLGEGFQQCSQHSPSREQSWEEALQRLNEGDLKVLVKASTARLREINFINRIQSRISQIETLVHPLSGEIINIQDWDNLRKISDDRVEVMQTMGKVMLDTETLAKIPLNTSLHYQIPEQTSQKSLPLEIIAQSLSRLPIMLREGYDTQPLNADDLTPWLLRYSEETQQKQSFRLVLLAATTGWDKSARLVIHGEQKGESFFHHLAYFYLFDMENGELLYNHHDKNLRLFAEIFTPLLPSEELEDTIDAVKKELLVYDSLTLQHAAQILTYPDKLIERAFEVLAASGRYTLTDVPGVGKAIVRDQL